MKEITVIYCTCDAYSDLWNNYFVLFQKYWADFVGQIILNTESKTLYRDGLNIVNLKQHSHDSSWSDMLYHALQYVNDEIVLLMLDDLYIKKPVNALAVANVYDEMKRNRNINGVSFQYEPGVRNNYKNLEGFQIRKRFVPYKMVATVALYRTDYLKKILRQGESAWDFEVNASFRTWFTKGIFLSKRKEFPPVFDYDGGGIVRHGKYNREHVNYFISEEGLLFSDRAYLDESKDENKNRIHIRRMMSYAVNAVLSLLKKQPR